MVPQYEEDVNKKLEELKDQAKKTSDSRDFEEKEKLFKEIYGHSSNDRVELKVSIPELMEAEIREARLFDIFEEVFEDKRVIGWVNAGDGDRASFPSVEFDLLISKFQDNYIKNNDLASKYWELWNIIGCNLHPTELLGRIEEEAHA
jgi:hypothetical protein